MPLHRSLRLSSSVTWQLSIGSFILLVTYANWTKSRDGKLLTTPKSQTFPLFGGIWSRGTPLCDLLRCVNEGMPLERLLWLKPNILLVMTWACSLINVYVCAWLYMHHIRARAHGGGKRKLDSLELELERLWATMWVLGRVSESSAKAADVLNTGPSPSHNSACFSLNKAALQCLKGNLSILKASSCLALSIVLFL